MNPARFPSASPLFVALSLVAALAVLGAASQPDASDVRDRLELVELTHRYAWAIDTVDRDLLARFFTPDASAHYVEVGPPVLGLDVAGVVREVGATVTRFQVGDEVFGIASGSIAEFAAAKETKLAHKPAGVTFEQAAASTVSGIAALQALTDVGGLVAGQRVLVIGASGGVGTFAVQLARVLGAIVDGVAGARNRELVESLGADTVYDHNVTELEDIDQRYDLILDIGGRNSVRRIRRLLTDDGTLVLVGGEGGNRVTGGIGRQVRAAMRSPFLRHRMKMFISTEHHDFIDRLAVHLASGQVAPHIGGRFPLDRAIDAVQMLEAGMSQGKTVIEVSHG